MKAESSRTIEQRRRRVALAQADGLVPAEIAVRLALRPEQVKEDLDAIAADPNNPAYLSPKRAFARRLDNLDALEQEAREHMESALGDDDTDAANRWFESIRRIAQERGRLLSQIGVVNRAMEQIPPDEPAEETSALSPKARKLIAEIALAEKLGRSWEAELRVEDTALDPVPDPEFAKRNPAGEPPATT
jgi:hypothetical protein